MLKEIIKLRTYPVGIKWIKESRKSLDKRCSAPATFCQVVRMAAVGGWHIDLKPEDVGCKTAQWIFGFRKPGDWDVEHHRQLYVNTVEAAKRLMASKPRFKLGEIKGIEVGPIEKRDDWDVVLVIVDSLQALRLLQAWTYQFPEGLELKLGSSSLICSFGAIASYQKEKAVLTLPCIGAKVYGLYQDFELVFAFPYGYLNNIAEGLKETAKRGHKIPYMPRFHLPPEPVDSLIKK